MKNVVKNVKKKKLIICGFLFFQLGTCVARDAHPPATLTWKKNGKILAADGKSKSSPDRLTCPQPVTPDVTL